MSVPLFNPDEVRRAINLLIESGSVFEIRATDATTLTWRKKRTLTGYFDNPTDVLKGLPTIATATGIYITLNPVIPDLLARCANRIDDAEKGKTTGDEHIIRRRRVVIDGDPVRPAGISSTNSELQNAFEKVDEVERFLTEQGFPPPFKAGSGNGGHLGYRIDLPANDGGLVEKFLKALSQKFTDDKVKIDETMFNPSRICKLYGTLACKGDSIPSRPHRYSQIVAIPDPLEIVSKELLEKVASLYEPAKTSTIKTARPATSVSSKTANDSYVRDFLKQHGVAVRSEHVKDGMTVIELETCPFNPAHGGHGEVAIFVQPDGTLGFGCHHNSCVGNHWREFRQHYEPDCYSGVPKHYKVDQYGSQTVITTGPIDRAQVKANEQASYAKAVAEFQTNDAAATENAIILPGNGVTITETAEKLFRRVAPTHTLFQRGGVVVELRADDHGVLNLDPVRPAAARSRLERYGTFFAWRAGRGGDLVLKPTCLQEDMARAFLESEPAYDQLPAIEGLVNCPVIIATDSGTTVIGRGYHAGTRLLIIDGEHPPEVELTEAVSALKDLLAEFAFQTAGDKSRALASFITPALKLGGHLSGNVAVDVAEADKSQSGKTYRQRIVAAIYNERAIIVTSRNGGVGSVDESFNAKLINGHPFIQLDNYRGRFDSPHIEAFLTAERCFSARVPHCREIDIDPSRFFVQMSSNGVETTRDFANRASIVRIRKQEGFVYRKYTEGDLLNHVRSRQPYYLGCVFAVVKAWVAGGCQRTNETRHDFREWSTSLDWIIRNIFNEAGLMDGHQSAQERVSNPGLSFLRKMALLVANEGRLGETLIASQLYEIAEQAELMIPGLKEADEDKGKRIIGGIMARLFKEGNRLEVDGFSVLREETQTKREDGRGGFTSKTYCFARVQTKHLPDASNASSASNTLNVQENGTDFLEVVSLAGVAGGLADAKPVPIAATPADDAWQKLQSMAHAPANPPVEATTASGVKDDQGFVGLF